MLRKSEQMNISCDRNGLRKTIDTIPNHHHQFRGTVFFSRDLDAIPNHCTNQDESECPKPHIVGRIFS